MEWIEVLLARCGIADTVKFDHLRNRVRCYAHIINICSSHIISSFTSTPESYLSQLKVTLDPDYLTHCNDGHESDSDSENESRDSDDEDVDNHDYELKLARCHRQGNPKSKGWVDTMKGDPLRCTRRVIRLLRSSDHHRSEFRKIIVNGNKHGFFTKTDSNGNQVKDDDVPELQVLRDVKTRWDSVYLMLLRLRELRPVSHSCCLQ